jgi:hypothetical protein
LTSLVNAGVAASGGATLSAEIGGRAGRFGRSDSLDNVVRQLEQLSHRDLRAIATRLGLRRRASHDRNVWISAIATAWSDPTCAARFRALLSPTALMVLARLQSAGSLPAGLFLADFGPLRRAGHRSNWDPPPWKAPSSPAEELFYCGLLVVDEHSVTVSAASRALAADMPCAEAGRADLVEADGAAYEDRRRALVHDVGQWLIFLTSEAPALAWDRWLRRRDLDALRTRLYGPIPAGFPQACSHARSHATDPYLRLVAFLAAAGGLVQSNGLTPLAWRWLTLAPTEQYQHLWLSWLAAAPDLAGKYRQPGGRLPPPWPRVLVDRLPATGCTFTAQDLVNAVLGGTPELGAFFAAHFTQLSEIDRTVLTVLQHALVPLSAVDLVAGGSGAGTRFVARPLRLSAVDWRSQGQADGRGRCTETPAGSLQVAVPWDAPLAHQAALALFARHQDELRSAATREHVYGLDEESVAVAAARGHGLPALLDAMTVLCGDAPEGRSPRLAAWWDAGRRIEITLAPLLRTSSPDLMRQLHEDPQVAAMLGELLAPTTCLLRTSPRAAQQALQAAGRPAVVVGEAQPAALPEKAAPRAGPEGGLAAWLAAQLYAALGQHLPLPAPFPQGQLAAWWAALSPAEQAAASSARIELLDSLAALLDGQTFAPPPETTDPARWVELLAEAIAAGAWVEMTYFSAGRNLLTKRTIEPYWLETRRRAIYVRGYCLSAARVRLFRLDRIQSLAVVPAGTQEAMPAGTKLAGADYTTT